MLNPNETLARKFYDIFNKRNLDAVAQVCDDKCTITNMATGEHFKGTDGARKWLQYWSKLCSDMQADVEVVAASETCVVVEGNARGVNDGPIVTQTGTLPASGKKLHMQWVDIIELRNNKITNVRCYFDTAHMYNQLGVSTQPQVAARPSAPGVAR